ncbi:MAG: hypothetical protein IJW99_00080 [Clostridia bacterium]|nr:hypothetical protein [Clostridia bacterium]
MALIKCPECRKKVSDLCKSCPRCGYPIQEYLEGEYVEIVDSTERKIISSHERFFLKVLTRAMVALIMVLFVACGVLFGIQREQVILDDSGNPIFVELTAEVYTNAKKYIGYHVNVTGRVFHVVKDEGTTKTIQVWLDPDICEQDIMISYSSDVDVEPGDYIACSGYIDSVVVYKNSFDAKLLTPLIFSSDLTKTSYMNVMAPATETIILPNYKQEKYGYSVSVEKIEFSEKETRVYATVTNNGGAILYTGDACIVQDNKQYISITNYEANYDEIPYRIVEGVSCSGIIVFPTMGSNDFELTLDIHSDNYEEEIGKFVFVVSKSAIKQKQDAIEAAKKYRAENIDVILSVYDLYEHLNSLGFSDSICEEISYGEIIDGFYNGAAMYDYERIKMFHDQGYSREAIIKFYLHLKSYEDAAFLVDQCLLGRKLYYTYVDGKLQLVEND